MFSKIKNNDVMAHTWAGQLIQPSDVYIIEPIERERWLLDIDNIMNALQSNIAIAYDADNKPLGWQTAIAMLYNQFNFSFAVDKTGINQNLSGNDWQVIDAKRILWDINSNYYIDNNVFIVPYDGVFFCDGKFRITDCSNVTAVEVALFKQVAGGNDEYWFVLDYQEVHSAQTVVQLSTAVMFDFYENETYTIKIKLYGSAPLAILSGSTDYTAWGCSFARSIHK